MRIVREHTYAYGAVCPFDGSSCYLILPRMDGDCMNVFLRELAGRHADAHLLVVCDGAPCHSGGVLNLPENLEIVKLPHYSPKLNPSENNGDDMREKFFGNVVFYSMQAVETRLADACNFYSENPQIVRSFAAWNWITDC